jgi:hypothetical protein
MVAITLGVPNDRLWEPAHESSSRIDELSLLLSSILNLLNCFGSSCRNLVSGLVPFSVMVIILELSVEDEGSSGGRPVEVQSPNRGR